MRKINVGTRMIGADMRIILGSRSEGRKEMLERMGYSFDVMHADIDEAAVSPECKPRRRARDLAHAKATAILDALPRHKAVLLTFARVDKFTAVVVTDVLSGSRADAVEANYSRPDLGLPVGITRRFLSAFGLQASTYTCLICGTTTVMPHDCPAFQPTKRVSKRRN